MRKQTRLQVLVDTRIKNKVQKMVAKKGLTISDVVRILLASIVDGTVSVALAPTVQKPVKEKLVKLSLEVPENLIDKD